MRRLKLIAVVAAVALGLAACTIWKEPKVATWKNTTSVEVMERLLWREIQAGNWVEVEARLASNFKLTTREGVYDKAEAIARWRRLRGEWPYESLPGEFTVTDQGDTAVVTYRTMIRYRPAIGGTQPKPREYRRLAVWQKQKEGYVLIALADMDLAGTLTIPMS